MMVVMVDMVDIMMVVMVDMVDVVDIMVVETMAMGTMAVGTMAVETMVVATTMVDIMGDMEDIMGDTAIATMMHMVTQAAEVVDITVAAKVVVVVMVPVMVHADRNMVQTRAVVGVVARPTLLFPAHLCQRCHHLHQNQLFHQSAVPTNILIVHWARK